MASLVQLPPGIEDVEWMRIALVISVEAASRPRRVLVHFWGMPEPVVLRPKFKSDQVFEARLDVSVVTSPRHFQAYLEDSQQVVVEVVQEQRTIMAYLDSKKLVDDDGGIVHELVFFDSHKQREVTSVRGSFTVKHRSKEERSKEIKRSDESNEKKGRDRLDFGNIKEGKCILEKRDEIVKFLAPPFVSKRDREFSKVKFVGEDARLITSSQSRGQESTFERPSKPLVTNNENLEPNIGYNRDDYDVTCTTDETEEPSTEEVVRANVARKSEMPKQQPNWNLSTKQIQRLSTITHLSVDVRAVTIKKNVLDAILAYLSKNFGAKGRGTAKTQPTKKPSQPVFFFISYALPNRESDFITACSRKIVADNRNNVSRIMFNHKCLQSVTFTPELLDKYYTAKVRLRLHCRALNQQRPTLLGQATIAMKHLLINDDNNEGFKIQRLSLFTSEEMRRAIDKNMTEILGEFEVSFKFVNTQQKREATSTKTTDKRVRSEAESKTSLGSESGLRSNTKTSTEKTPDGDPEFRQKELAALNEEICEEATVLLRVRSGRNFVLDQNSAPSVFISVRMFDPSEKTTSAVSWQNTAPHFGLQVSTKISLSKSFVKGLEDNFVVVEVWKVNEPKNEIIGIAMLSLQQFFLALKTRDRAEQSLSDNSIAIVAVDDWVSVQSLNTGQIIGELSCLLALGSEKQINELIISSDQFSKSEKSIKKQSKSSKSFSERVGVRPPSINEDRPYKHVLTEVNVLEGRNLPHVFDVQAQKRTLPSSYVTFLDEDKTQVSSLMMESANPKWNFIVTCKLKSHLYWDPSSYFILKIWHHSLKSKNSCVDLESDSVIGFVAIDLGLLVRGNFDALKGWFNVMDYLGRCKGQIKVCIRALDDLSVLKPIHKKACLERKESKSSTFKEGDGVDDEDHDRTSSIDCIRRFEWSSNEKSSDSDTITHSLKRNLANENQQRDFTTPIDETMTRSLLERKIDELTNTTNNMRVRLGQQIQFTRKESASSSSSSSSSRYNDDKTKEPPEPDDDIRVIGKMATFSELQDDIVRQLSKMRELNQRTFGARNKENNADEILVETNSEKTNDESHSFSATS